ncbi:ChaB family protein [Nocardiopsis lambiniae]|uniref:ChaB family protein n=1 Tax=Nocardiopsis lambiniae TaxID=3075539 RepID=A0ABU2M6Y8_9ACTN|nr:ChaB family protein [Nocardiopsis sp. DSM 44743]MDT0328359.1 ChaB family protein [Nocardiopsis sp. DSM 44743]
MPGTRELPDTLRRSSKKAQRTWIKAHDSAVERYGEGERAHRVAMAAVKHAFEKVGDHWEPKKDKGPSDARAADPNARKRGRGDSDTAGGVNANATKEHLYEQARRLGVEGRSKMTKSQLVDALRKESDDRTSRARS